VLELACQLLQVAFCRGLGSRLIDYFHQCSEFALSSGIPDFRTPGSGLYANLQRFELPTPQSIFDIDFFRWNPLPFLTLAQEIWPGQHRPTPGHCFLKILEEKGLLRRVYTQNIDSLELSAGLTKDKVVTCHGSFDTASCIDCRDRSEPEAFLRGAHAGMPARCKCGGLIKPDVVFFGEQLPAAFDSTLDEDMARCDLLLVIGTRQGLND
jgi:NAD-dependent SIR2 family protein deacetylase